MKVRILFLSFASVFTVLAIVILFIANINKIRWDKVPVVGSLILEINLYPAGFDASYLDKPIEWHQLDEEPADWEGNGLGSWFAINPYTVNLLKNYMRENNLGIVPDSWPDLEITSNFEECLETFDFVSLGEPPSKDNTLEHIGYAVAGVAVCLAVLFWVLYFKAYRGDGSSS